MCFLFSAIGNPVAGSNPAALQPADRWIESVSTVDTDEKGVHINGKLNDGSPVYVRLDVLADDLIRFRVNLTGKFSPTLQENDGFIRHDWPVVEHTIQDVPAQIRIETDRFIVRIQKSPFHMELYQSDKLLTRTIDTQGIRFLGDKSVIALQTPPDEMFFGFGYQGSRYVYPFDPERDPFNRRGSSVQMLGLSNHRVYFIPFFQSSNGYGFFLNTLTESFWDMAKTHPDYYTVTIDEPQVDIYLIPGTQFKDILKRYSSLVGRPDMPPKWLLGESTGAEIIGITRPERDDVPAGTRRIMYHGWDVRWYDQSQALQNARNVRQNRIPADYYHFDSAWQTIRSSFEWVRQIPDPGAMLDSLNAMNFKVGLWTRPTLHLDDYPLTNEAVEKGYLIRRPTGEPLMEAHSGQNKVMVDFTNPDAVVWWQNYLMDLVKLGVRTFKMDSESGGWNENYPEAKDALLFGGRTGREMENYLGPLHAKTVFDALREALDGKRAVLHAVFHPAYFASSRYAWMGFGDRTHRATLDLRLRIAQNYAMCGVAFWRGGEFHSFGLPIVDSELRRRLNPYTYTYWYQAHTSGLPIIRPMMLEYQDDPEAFKAQYQIMYGQEFLVAPGVLETEVSRTIYPPKLNVLEIQRGRWEEGKQWQKVYLPEGEWINYWTKEKYMGPEWRYFQVHEDRPALLVKGGSIIPKGPLMEYMEQKPMNPLELEIYPYNQSGFTIYEDHGDSYAYEAGEYAQTRITSRETPDGIIIEIEPTNGRYDGMPEYRDYQLRIIGVTRPDAVKADGREIRLMQGLSETEPGWEMYDDPADPVRIGGREIRSSQVSFSETDPGWKYEMYNDIHREVVIRIPVVIPAEGVTVELVNAKTLKFYF